MTETEILPPEKCIQVAFRIPISLRNKFYATAENMHMTKNTLAIYALEAGARAVQESLNKGSASQ